MTEDEWIIQWDIINHEGEDKTYIFNRSSGEKNYTLKVPVPDGRLYKHIYHAYPETVKEGKVHLTIYQEGESTPVEEVTYYIDFD